jgi:hypothetical protein
VTLSGESELWFGGEMDRNRELDQVFDHPASVVEPDGRPEQSYDAGGIPRIAGVMAILAVAVMAIAVPALFSAEEPAVVSPTSSLPVTTLPPETTSTSQPAPTVASEPWVKQTLPGIEGGGEVSSVAGIGATVVAIGHATCTADEGCRPTAWVSLDLGAMWIAVDLGSPRFAVRGIAASDEGFLAVGTAQGFLAVGTPMPLPAGVIWSTADGINWERSLPPELSEVTELAGVAHGPAGFVATSSVLCGYWDAECQLNLWISPDGSAWSVQALDLLSGGWVSPSTISGYDGGYALVVNVGELVIWASPDAREWNSGLAIAETFGTNPIVAASSLGTVVIDDRTLGRTPAFSADGETWSDVTFADPGACSLVRFTDVVASDSGFVAAGRCGNVTAVWASDSGASWRLVARNGEEFGGGRYLVYADGDGVIVVGNEPDVTWATTLAAP